MALTYYNLKKGAPDGALTLTKFDGDLNPVTSYNVTKGCTCAHFYNRKTQCRHLATILPALRAYANLPVFYCWEAGCILTMNELAERERETTDE